MSLFHLYTAYAIVRPEHLRSIHVAFVLFLTFLIFPVARALPAPRHVVGLAAGRRRPSRTTVYLIAGGDDFFDRSILPNNWDIVFGVGLALLILEAMRRTTGWMMPIVTTCFLLYAFFGEVLPAPWTHKDYEIPRLVGHMYMTLEGIYGTAISVSSTLIILFTIYGAFLQFSGAGKFYIDFSFAAMGGKPTSAGRTVTLSSFLLGGPSGSGVATTVTLGAVAAPMLAKVGYSKDEAGGLLAAGGLGAIISPPVLGAAAFLIAEFLKISYLDVVLMATIPTCLYYLALFIMVEIDVRKFGMKDVLFEQVESAWSLTKKYWFHFLSLVSIVVFMLLGLLAGAVGVLGDGGGLRHELPAPRLRAVLLRFPARARSRSGAASSAPGLIKALDGGSRAVLNVAATCAGAGPHRRRGDAHRPGAEIQLDRARLRRQLAAAHRDLHRAHRLDRGPRGAGDRELHHLRGDRRAGADRAQGAGVRRAHVHLLLRGAVGSLAADGAVAVRGRRDHRRRPVQDHAAVLEVHDARVPRAVHVRARPERHRACC